MTTLYQPPYVADTLRPRFEIIVNRYGATLGTRSSSYARRLSVIETRSASTIERALHMAGQIARKHNMIIRYQLARREGEMTYYPCVKTGDTEHLSR
ncbi:hypothetical protein [Streptomyces sp. Je 1-332]|uniref:hypothetical protein n=1 Tax=Streptomyces sp. Je 1-332 TaxID=3231270 RepID=UPI0034588909